MDKSRVISAGVGTIIGSVGYGTYAGFTIGMMAASAAISFVVALALLSILPF